MFTVESHLRYLAEVSEGQLLTAATTLVEADRKRLRLHSELYADGELAATGECLYLHVDTAAGRTTPAARRPSGARRRDARGARRGAPAGPPRPRRGGTGMSDRVTTPYEGRPAVWDDAAEIEAPLRLHRTNAPPEWMDYNDHMSESCYLLAFGDSADAFFRFLGIDEAYRAAGHSLYTSETHLHHRHEVALDDPLELTLQLLDHDRRRLHIYHQMRHGESGELLADAEQLLVHVDMTAGRSSDLPDHLLERLDRIAAAHADLPRPDVVGRPIGIRRQA